MKFKSTLINLLITFTSIYLPLFFFSFFKFLSTPKNSFYEESLNLEIAAVENGYLPIFYPDQILKNKNIPESYPIGTLPLTPSYFCNEGYGLITFISDRFGLRNNDKNWNNVMNKSNIFIIGDSFAQGACVQDDFTITNYLEENTRKNIINMATGANGPYEYKAVIKTLLKPIIKNSENSNTAILIFYPNDDLPFNRKREDLLNSANSIVKFKSNGEIVANEKYINDLFDFITNFYPNTKKEIIKEIKKGGEERLNSFKYSSLYNIISLLPVRRSLRAVLTKFPLLNQSKNTTSPSIQAIEFLANICIDVCKPVVTYIPPSNYWTRYLNADNFKKDLRNISNKNGILFIDGEEVINRNNIKDYAPEAEHLSLEGYKKIADLIKKSLVKK